MPTNEPIANFVVEQPNTILKPHLPKFGILYFPLVCIINGDIVMQEFKVVLPIVLRAYPRMYAIPDLLISYKILHALKVHLLLMSMQPSFSCSTPKNC